MFRYVSLEQRVSQDHPLRAFRKLTDAALGRLSPELDALYAGSVPPLIAPRSLPRNIALDTAIQRLCKI
jgi:hypothetical protein